MIDPQAYYRRLYYSATLCNSLSFNLMLGNLLTLFLLQIGTSKSMMGLISAFPWFALLFGGMGKGLIRQYGVVKTMSRIWITRAFLLIPQVFAPIMILLGSDANVVIVMLIITQLFFQICRGIGIATNTPIFAKLTNEKQRTGFFVNMQVATNVGSVIVIISSSLLLRYEKLWMYSIFYGSGIILGIVTGLMYGLQEEVPQGLQDLEVSTPPPESKVTEERQDSGRGNDSLLATLLEFFSYKKSRLFAVSALLSYGLSAVVNVFLIVYIKEAYSIGDSLALTYLLGGPIAIIIFGLGARPLLNRMGPKPVCVMTTIFLACGVAAMLLDMHASVWLAQWIFLLNIMIVISTVGLQDSLQAYFLDHLNDRNNLNKGLVVNILRGIAGFAAIFAGFFLDNLRTLPQLAGYSNFQIFRIFWSIFLLLVIINIVLLLCLKRGSAMTLSQSIAVFCSPRAWQGVWMLELGQKQATPMQHKELLSSIGKGPASSILSQELPQLLRAPDLLLRLEALQILGDPNVEITEELQDLLIKHVDLSPYTTGANAANILGRRSIEKAIPTLHKALASDDYNLVAQAILALGRLGHKSSLDDIRKILLAEHQNQRICIYAINSVKLLGKAECDIPLLLQCCENWRDSRRMQEEIALAISTLLGIEKEFYQDYCSFIEAPAQIWKYKWQLLIQVLPESKSLECLTKREEWYEWVELNEWVKTLGNQHCGLQLSQQFSKIASEFPGAGAPAPAQGDYAHWFPYKQTTAYFWQTPSGLFLELLLLYQLYRRK